MDEFNATTYEPCELNYSKSEVNTSSITLTSSYGGNCTSTSECGYSSNVLAVRRYDIALICSGVLVASVCFNAVLVDGLVRRGGRAAVGVVRSSLMLNMVAGDWVHVSGGCGMLVMALVGGRWPFGDFGCSLYSLSTTVGHVVAYYTFASFIIERSVSTRRKFRDNWKQRRGSVTSVALAIIARSRERQTRRFVVTTLTVCWLVALTVGLFPVCIGWFSVTGCVDSLICAVLYHRGAVAGGFITSLVVGCLLPVAISGAAYWKFVSIMKVTESESERCSRRQSSLAWLATRMSRRSSRFSVVSAERRSVSSACEVVLRDVDVTGKRLHDDETSQEKKWTKMILAMTTTSLFLTSPWYVATVIAVITDHPSHYEWSVMTSLLSHVIVVLHPVCVVVFSSRSRSGSWARRRVGKVSVCPSTSLRLPSLSGGDRPGGGRVARTCRLHSAPECTLRSMLPAHLRPAASPTALGLAPIEEHSHKRSTSGTSPAVHRMSPRISSATPVDEAQSPTSECLQLSPVSPTDSGLCPTPLQQRVSPASSPRSSPGKLERFFGEQLRATFDDPKPREVISTSSPRVRSLSPCPVLSAKLGGMPRESRIITTTTHQQSTLSAPLRHRPVDVQQLSYVQCE